MQGRALVERILAYLEEAREQSGTEGKLGADDVKFDNESGKGQEVWNSAGAR